jgi:Phytanoyl-CoA dioxygenase (PhyH)
MAAREDDRTESEHGDDKRDQFLDRLAVFGSSGWGLLASLLLLLVAIAVHMWIDSVDSPLPPAPAVASRTVPINKEDYTLPTSSIQQVTYELSTDHAILSEEMMNAYRRDGVIAIRGLLSNEILAAMNPASQQLVTEQQERNTQRGYRRPSTQFHTVQLGPSFLLDDAIAAPFRTVALNTVLPSIAAQLLDLDESQSLRMLRDILLAKDNDPYVCGYHVDDTGFWPATADSPGVNAWIALDDMPTVYGGGFALAVGSHKAAYSAKAHKVTGSTRTFPRDGFKDAADMFANRSGSGTCNLKTAAPEVNSEMEATMRIYEIHRGDIIFHDRWLFHRTVPFIDRREERIWRRYSVRYAPGSAVIPPGYGTEPSVLWNEANGGRTADQVAELDGPWYPRCWPSVDKAEMDALPMVTAEKLPKAEELRKTRQKEIKTFLNGRMAGTN